MTASVSVSHNFETGHRLPILQGKCQNLHGHSWYTTITYTAPGRPDTVIEFGELKHRIRDWIDTHLDHGLMLGKADPLAALLVPDGKVHIFGEHEPCADIMWPTVENVALMLARVAAWCATDLDCADGTHVSRVEVRETAVNQATWTPE